MLTHAGAELRLRGINGSQARALAQAPGWKLVDVEPDNQEFELVVVCAKSWQPENVRRICRHVLTDIQQHRES